MGKRKTVPLTKLENQYLTYAARRQDVQHHVDYLPWRLAVYDYHNDDPSEIEFLLVEAAQEPAAILAGYRRKVGLNSLDTNLMIAAEEYVDVLCALRNRLAQWDLPLLPPELEQQLRAAALAFVSKRDLVETFKQHTARSKGGKTMAFKKVAEKAALHKEIRNEAARLRGGYLQREATGILARKFNLSPSQIRRIMKQKT